ncbi:phosphoglycerate mutase [Marilutibacter chinensis]|uniref:Phosphoglycerate mutase n=1 Tax=Marilutibacter chinensis TaxID=2912247 RepID=A0ABS9HMR4_9GAMM|nr:phosphoglycerate mutase [Lysobacter chinensis]MCF7220311.1 phosphoglycerate mutase [Lysobacter chinensis]
MRVSLLLPDPARFGGQRLFPDLARTLGRADATHDDRPQRERVFDVLPRGWPVAAVTRQGDVGDAADAIWLRADPAYVRPDINGARLLAHGRGLRLTEADAAAFLSALRPLFGDLGSPIDAPVPSRWYLRLPQGSRLPAFSSPEEALGDELFEHLPGAGDESDRDRQASRRWRGLLSEAQIVLHNHPRNAERAAAGLPMVNSLWFWGGGQLPDRVRCAADAVHSDDDALAAFANLAGVTALPLPAACPDLTGSGDCLFDLREARDLARLQGDWLQPLIQRQNTGTVAEIVLDCADGSIFTLRRSQRWRFWRRSRERLGA